MNEIKPCPFCKHFEGFSVILPYEEDPGHVACMFCGAETPFDIWNTRPIEDALQSHIAGLEAFINKLIEAGTALDVPSDDYSEEQKEWREIVSEWKEREK